MEMSVPLLYLLFKVTVSSTCQNFGRAPIACSPSAAPPTPGAIWACKSRSTSAVCTVTTRGAERQHARPAPIRDVHIVRTGPRMRRRGEGASGNEEAQGASIREHTLGGFCVPRLPPFFLWSENSLCVFIRCLHFSSFSESFPFFVSKAASLSLSASGPCG